jgi:hypothetical protein
VPGVAESVKKVGRLITGRRTSLPEQPAGHSQALSRESSSHERRQASVEESDPSMHVKFHDVVEVLELEASSPTSVPAAA